MSVFIIDNDGQVFHSPEELDAFSYYRDYHLVRIFKEFFDLNPRANTGGFEDYSGSDLWEIEDVDEGEYHWEGKTLVIHDKSGDPDFIPTEKLFPDGETEMWTRYLKPSHIRFEIRDAAGNLKQRKFDLAAMGDGEFMENVYVGDAPNGEGIFIWWDVTIPLDPSLSNWIKILSFSSTNGANGDRFEKIELKFSIPPQVDKTFNFYTTGTAGVIWIRSNVNPNGVILAHAPWSSGHGEISHSLWNGSSWDTYGHQDSYGQPYNFLIGHDGFGVVHYLLPWTYPIPPYPTGYEYDVWHYTWTLAGGYNAGTRIFSSPFKERLSFTLDNDGHSVIYDINGYIHFYFLTSDAITSVNKLRHYYQDGSGWHLGEIGSDIFTGWTNYGRYLIVYFDNYGRTHIFTTGRNIAANRYGMMYITNRDGGWNTSLIDPFLEEGSTAGILYLRAWITAAGQQYIICWDQHSIVGGLKVCTKFWDETNWIFSRVDGVEDGEEIHRAWIHADEITADLIYYPSDNQSGQLWELIRINVETLEVIKRNLYAGPDPIHHRGFGEPEFDLGNITINMKDGKPHWWSEVRDTSLGFSELEIDE